ncbi:MAG: hypothetical protein IJ551_01750, partial [Prevotella sp.]|nr:hypothetical protein [Prevotella sp.]
MNINYDSVIRSVKRHLAIIGKRLRNKEGKNLFSDITLSSAEDKEILTQYINAAAQNVAALLRPLLSSYTISTDEAVLTLDNTRSDADFENRCQDLSTTYMVLFTTGEYLAMLHPELAQKYQTDAANAIQSLTRFSLYKQPPTPSHYSYAAPTGIITPAQSSVC